MRCCRKRVYRVFKHLGIRCVHKQAVYLIGKIVAGGTENRPAIRQLFGFEEDFFADDVERLVGWIRGNTPVILFPSRRPPCPPLRCPQAAVLAGVAKHPNETGRLQPSEILFRIPQSIGMVNPQAADLSCCHQREDQPVRFFENGRVLHPDGAEGIDIEEPAGS